MQQPSRKKGPGSSGQSGKPSRPQGASRGASRGHLSGSAAGGKPKGFKPAGKPARPGSKPAAGAAKTGKPARPASAFHPGSKVRVKPMTPNRERGFAGGDRPYDYAFYEKAEATPEYLAALFADRDYAVSPRELEAYWKYYCLLREHNAELDLTRIMGIEATVLKHFIDCSIVADLTELEGPILDIGSGPGFPGAPIAIRRPDLPVILAESRGKRVTFLEMVKKELNLENVTIYPRSVREDSALNARTIVTRAVEVIPATLQRVKPFLAPGGRVVFMKGPGCGQEITEAQQEFKGVYKMTQDLHYDLPRTNQSRRLVVFTKREEEGAE